MPTPIIVVPDIEGSGLYANAAFFEIIGIDRALASGEDLLAEELFASEDLAHVQAGYAQLLAGESLVTVAGRLNAGSHGRLHFRVQARRFERADSPGTYGIVSVFMDVDDETRGQQAFDRAESQLSLLESTGDFSIYDWADVTKEEILWSDSHYRLLGYEPGDITPSAELFYKHVHPADLSDLQQAVELVAAEPGMKMEREFRLRDGEGLYRWMYTKAQTFVTAYGTRRMVGILLAAGAETQINLDVQAVKKELEDFVYSVAHDLRAPVRHIETFVALLSETALSKLDLEETLYLRHTADASKRLGIMVDSLLQYRNLRSSEARRVWVPIEAAVASAVERLDPLNDARFQINITGDLPEVRATPGLIEQLVMALLANAVHFSETRDRPIIEVRSVLTEDGDIGVEVEDNGIGFDQKDADKLFGMFQRGHRSELAPGVGIGLAVAKRIVNLHGGHIWCRGEVNNGATFGFAIPESRLQPAG